MALNGGLLCMCCTTDILPPLCGCGAQRVTCARRFASCAAHRSSHPEHKQTTMSTSSGDHGYLGVGGTSGRQSMTIKALSQMCTRPHVQGSNLCPGAWCLSQRISGPWPTADQDTPALKVVRRRAATVCRLGRQPTITSQEVASSNSLLYVTL